MNKTKLNEKEVIVSINQHLPNNENNLINVENKIEKVKIKLKKINLNRTINDNTHNELYEEIIGLLDWVGRMSMPIFEIRNDLEMIYEKKYPRSPKLAFKLFDEHYSKLHYPYSKLKNRCFTLLTDLDKTYVSKYLKQPPNYKI